MLIFETKLLTPLNFLLDDCFNGWCFNFKPLNNPLILWNGSTASLFVSDIYYNKKYILKTTVYFGPSLYF